MTEEVTTSEQSSYISVHNQSPLELAKEYVEGLKKLPEASPDAIKLFDHYVQLERKGVEPIEMLEGVTKRNNGIFNLLELPLIKDKKCKFTMHALYWIACQSSDIPAYCTTVLGIYATLFYETHHPNERVTLEYIGSLGGKGHLFNFRTIYPWAMSSMNKDKKSIFEEYDYFKKESRWI